MSADKDVSPVAGSLMAPPTMSMPLTVWETPADTVTIGVAIELPAPWADYLQQCRESFGDTQAAFIPPHITLLPPTPLPREDFTAIDRHLHAVAGAAGGFEIRLVGTGTFRPVSPVVFVQVYSGGTSCDVLQKAIRTGPLERGLPFPYHPHVTVAHHLDDEALDRAQETLRDFSVTFTVTGFGVFEHGRDGIWRPERRYSFGREG
jgi:2'-5' RNA ligase